MVESLNEASEEEMVKKEAISRLADFFRVSHGALSKFKFDGNDNVKELTKALNSTSDQGTELYYKMAIKLAKKEVGVEESEEAIKALEEAMVQVAGKNKPSGAQVLAMVIVDHLIERDFFKPGIEKMKKQVIVDIQKVIMDSTF
jgi:SpoU rRNA methylase family enzyme